MNKKEQDKQCVIWRLELVVMLLSLCRAITEFHTPICYL